MAQIMLSELEAVEKEVQELRKHMGSFSTGTQFEDVARQIYNSRDPNRVRNIGSAFCRLEKKFQAAMTNLRATLKPVETPVAVEQPATPPVNQPDAGTEQFGGDLASEAAAGTVDGNGG